MKKIYYGFLLACSIAFCGCSTDFDLTSDWKDITVVYGLINQTDTAQYFKINKAYLSESTNALELAQVHDSIFYQNLDVRLLEFNDAGTQTADVQLTRINGNDEPGIGDKPTGVFLNEPNWLYKTTHTINPDRSYKLVVTKSDGNVATAETNVVSDLQMIRPFIGQQVNMVPGDGQKYNASWKNAENASFYGLTIRMFYTEYPNTNPADSIQKSFDWVVFTDYVPAISDAGFTVEYPVASNLFYQEIAKQINVDPGLTRRARHLEFIYAAGGPELYTYYLVSQAQQGITSGQISPEYTNVTGGKGVFSSRIFRSSNVQLGGPVPIKNTTVDSIACNALTKDLRFLNSQGLLCP